MKKSSRTLRGCVDWNTRSIKIILNIISRTLRGCVDWNLPKLPYHRYEQWSHPTWVRGLKLIETDSDDIPTGRTLRGCVDWNPKFEQTKPKLKSHPTWVRGLKHVINTVLSNLLKSHPTWAHWLNLKIKEQKRLVSLHHQGSYAQDCPPTCFFVEI